MEKKEEGMRPVIEARFELELTDEEWQELGYDPEKITEEDINLLIPKMYDMLGPDDFMPLLRRAARALGKQVKRKDSDKDILSTTN